jgi:hypothetical protein
MLTKKIFISSSLIGILCFASCKKDSKSDPAPEIDTSNKAFIEATTCTGISPSYAMDVKPILEVKCAIINCHNTATAVHGLNLEGYKNTKAHFNAHELLCAINQVGDCDKMPKDGPKLSDIEIKIITCWAKNNFPE